MTTTHAIKVNALVSTLNDSQSQTNQRVLQPILSDLIVFARNVKQLHWNVIGPHFRAIHLHLDEIYDLAETATDDVAERLSATGHSPDGRLRDVGKASEIEDAPIGFLEDKRVLEIAEGELKKLIGGIRTRMKTIEDVDTVTADILHQIVHGLEKHHWMIQSQRL